MPIHPTAIVDPKAEIDPAAEIGPYAIVEENARIGAGTRLWPHAFVGRDTRMGEGNEVHPGAAVGHAPQDRNYKRGTRSFLEVGDENVFREGSSIHRGTEEGATTRIGSGFLFMATSHAGHDCRVADGVTFANCALLGGHVSVGNGAILAGGAMVHQFVRIGRLAMIAGGARVRMDVPPFMLTEHDGSVRQLNIIGLQRDPDIPDESVAALKGAFRALYREGLSLRDAIARLEKDFDAPEVVELTEFLKAESKRGIARPPRAGGRGNG